MDFRTKRQLIILLVVIFVIALPIAFFVYRAIPKATCFDNKQNQGEEDVDCGGPCVPCALKHPQDLGVFWVRFVPVRENTYDVAGEIRNPNIKLGTADFAYSFRFYDDAGVLVAERTGHSFIFPGETMHLVETGIVTLRTLKQVTLTITHAEWVFTDALPPDVVLGDKQLHADASKKSSVLTATVVNRSLFDFHEVFIDALILDGAGNIIAVSKTVENDVRSGETRPVQFSWPFSIDQQNPQIVTEVRVNTFSR